MTGAAKRKPIGLHIHDPKQHLGKDEKDARADAEITMGTLNFFVPANVKKIPGAMRKWREVTKIYKAARLTVVSSTDSGVIGRYCMLYAEYDELIEQRRLISDLDFPADDMDEILAETDAEYRRARARRLWNIMEYFTKLDGLLRLDKAINTKLKAILDVEDRIFMNPAAKVRTLPIRRKPKAKDEMGDMGFDV